MDIEQSVFLKYVPDFEKMKKYGFTPDKNNNLFIQKTFMDSQFRAVVTVTQDGEIKGLVYDNESNDLYLPLRVSGSGVGYVEEVKSEYTKVLEDIRQNCFIENYFVTPQANRISDFIFKKYNDKPVFMWEKEPTYGVFKNPDNNKWYGLIMYIPRSKLEKSGGFVEVINIKLDKDEIPTLVKKSGIFPAWHMNKKYWVSVALDETLTDDEIMQYIEISHNYTLLKLKK